MKAVWWYSLIVDEARDAFKLEQMSMCIRYVHKSIIKEQFLEFVQVIKLDWLVLIYSIIKFSNSVFLDIIKCKIQSYGGRAVMSGSTNGVYLKIKNISKNKCLFIHCCTHRLNLVFVNIVKLDEIVDDTMG